jgi:alkylation response protein AidB-like acyl-CoA dehydrogenase
MNFEHNDDRRMLADSLNRFVTEQYGFAHRDRIAHGDAGMCPQMWRRFAELGVIGALFSEADGGFGGAGFDILVVFEALGRGLVVEPFLATVLGASVIASVGTDAQKETMSDLIAAVRSVAFAHAEPDCGHALSRVATHARPDGDGWVLDGAKAVVLNAEHADLFVVSARTDGGVDDADGISLFLVAAGTPGLVVRGYPLIDGGRAAEVALDGVRVGAGALIGKAGDAAQTIELAIGRGVLALCAEAIGAMDRAKDLTLEYLRTRKQFGVPIGSFQALQHRMADLLLEIEQARSAVINAAAALDGDRLARERALSAAKYTIGRIGIRCAEECVQLHGGIGMTWELPLSHFAKRLVMIDHQLGDEDHHLARYIELGRTLPAVAC